MPPSPTAKPSRDRARKSGSVFQLLARIRCLVIGLLVLAVVMLLGQPAIASELSVSTALHAKGNLGNDVLYYLFVDRFYDGDRNNNIPSAVFPLDTGDPEEKAYNQANRALVSREFDPTHRYINLYWGGDLEGIIAKLDYLQDLGITKLILSPILDNANAVIYNPSASGYLHAAVDPDAEQIDPFYSHLLAPYHGFWVKDWFEIDEHFRDPDESKSDRLGILRRLLDEAGDRGIGIILHFPLNSTSPYRGGRAYDEFDFAHFESWLVDNGAVYRHGEQVAPYWSPTEQVFDPQGWFHEPKFIDFNRPTAEALEKAAIGGIPDLAQEVSEVEDYLLESARFWLTFNEESTPIAGFLVDSIANINVTFWQHFEREVLRVNPDTILIAAYGDGGYRNRGSIQWYDRTQHYALVNHELSDAARRFFASDRAWDGRTATIREEILGCQGRYYNYSLWEQALHRLLNPSESLEIPRDSAETVAEADAKSWLTFVENFDRPRLLTAYPSMSPAAYASAIAFSFVAPGVPTIYYGMETGLAVPYHLEHAGTFGIGSDPFNRQMAIFSDDLGWNLQLHAVTKRLAHLRRDCPVLRYGSARFLTPDPSRPDKDIFLLRESKAEAKTSSNCPGVLFAYSTNGGQFHLPLPDRYQQLREIATGKTPPIESGIASISLAPETAKVFRLLTIEKL